MPAEHHGLRACLSPLADKIDFLSSAHFWIQGWSAPNGQTLFTYQSYGMVATEVEIDVLTGEVQIARADILLDCGDSLNPAVDIGQVEGGFVMGLGAILTEEVGRNTGDGPHCRAR